MEAVDKEAREGAVRRVKAMLAMAKDSAASEGERDNALRMAHKTMAKFGIEAAEAEAAGTKSEEARTSESSLSRNQPWTRKMASAIAALFMCEYYYSQTDREGISWVDLRKSGKVRHVFVGRTSNAVTAADVARFVIESTMSEANKRWKLQPDPGPWWSDFCKGAAQRVVERCLEIRRKAEEESRAAAVTGRSLVLASLYAQESAKNKLILAKLNLVVKKPREKAVGLSGYSDGRKFGDGLSLSRKIGAASKVAIGVK